MTKISYQYWLLGLCLIALSACGEDDTDVSEITNVPFTIESVDAGQELSEKTQVYTVNFRLDEDQIVDTKVSVTIDAANTTATVGEDFNFTPVEIEIPAYVRDGSFQYEVLEDLDAEDSETITFALNGVFDPFGATNTQTHSVTIRDSVYTGMQMVFDWEGTFEFMDSEFTLCSNVDLDIYVLDGDGNDLGIYDAASANCPEVLPIEDWDDGEYFLASNLYDNGLDSLFLFVDYPITVTAVKGGVFKETFVPEDIWTSEDEDFIHDDVTTFKEVAKVTVSGTTYTVELPDGSLIATGFAGNSNLPSKPHAGKSPSQ
ncbi:MAG: hypothetical protein AAFW73_09950 [Bacteroidota bacterium]